jgi:hypothetical protein
VEHWSTGSWAPSDGVRVGCPRYSLRSEYKRILKQIFIRFKANKWLRFTLIRFEANISKYRSEYLFASKRIKGSDSLWFASKRITKRSEYKHIIEKRNKTNFFYCFAPFCDVNFLHLLCSEANILKQIKANWSKYFEANIHLVLKQIFWSESKQIEANILKRIFAKQSELEANKNWIRFYSLRSE